MFGDIVLPGASIWSTLNNLLVVEICRRQVRWTPVGIARQQRIQAGKVLWRCRSSGDENVYPEAVRAGESVFEPAGFRSALPVCGSTS